MAAHGVRAMRLLGAVMVVVVMAAHATTGVAEDVGGRPAARQQHLPSLLPPLSRWFWISSSSSVGQSDAGEVALHGSDSFRIVGAKAQKPLGSQKAKLYSPGVPVDAARTYLLQWTVRSTVTPVATAASQPTPAFIATPWVKFHYASPSGCLSTGWPDPGCDGETFPHLEHNQPWQPPPDGREHRMRMELVVPTTASQLVVHFEFASVMAWGNLSVSNLTLLPTLSVGFPAVQIRAPKHSPISVALEIASGCLFNRQLNSELASNCTMHKPQPACEGFHVSDGFKTSDNTSPDLAFGLFGVRRHGFEGYTDIYRDTKWRSLAAKIAENDGNCAERQM
eukprot:COSAG06_NODE_14619_length_1142_cov_1.626079_1_plen_336_part_01